MTATSQDLAARALAAVAEIERRDVSIQALVTEPGRAERVAREAGLRERRLGLTSADVAHLLAGVKDIYRVDGLPTTCGSQLPEELFAGPEAPLVTRLREAGFLILGKTVTTEFAYFEPGPTRNPRNLDHTPGGSSSGSAAAVAAGYCRLALGSQTVGSVIRPAAFCGVAAFKPSFGLLSLEGVIPYAPTLDHAGFFVPTAAELAPALSILAGQPQAAPSEGCFAIPTGAYLHQAGSEALTVFRRQANVLREMGFEVRDIPMFADIEAINHRHQRLAAAELAETHRDWFPRYEALYRPRTAALIREGAGVPGEEILAGRASCVQLRASLQALMEAEGVAAWICPSATGPAPRGLDSTGDPVMNLPWTHSGLPVATVPAGLAANGLPIGLQVVGRWQQDAALAALAAQIAAQLPGAD